MVRISRMETGAFHEHEKKATMSSEQTVSLLLRGINNKSQLTHSGNAYGVCLAHALQERGVLKVGQTVLMIGDGLGYNSEQLHETTERQGLNVEYIGFDLSPALREQQKKRNPWQSSVEGNALALTSTPLPKNPHGILLNEVIADFPVLEVDHELFDHLVTLTKSKTSINRNVIRDIVAHFKIENIDHLIELLRILQTYDFNYPRNNGSSSLIINSGSVRFLEQAAKVIPQGGWIWLSEYGFEDPKGCCQGAWTQDQVKSKGHQEWTIDFYFLSQVARKLGFKVALEKLNDVIGIKNNEFSATGFIDDNGERLALGPDKEPMFFSLEEMLSYYSRFLSADHPILPSLSINLFTARNRSPTLAHDFNEWAEKEIRRNNRIPFSRDLPDDVLEKTIGIMFDRVGELTDQFYSLLLIKE